MKKSLILVALAAALFSAQVLADTVSITSQSTFTTPSGNITSTGSYAFVGPKTIVFEVAGKTCSLNGSARGSVPMGCNYQMTVSPSGKVSGILSAGNSVCTQSDQIAASCK